MTLTVDTAKRIDAALTEEMTVEELAPGMCVVESESGNTYTVDLRDNACECPDFQYRGDTIGCCKHILRCAAEFPDVVIEDTRRGVRQ